MRAFQRFNYSFDPDLFGLEFLANFGGRMVVLVLVVARRAGFGFGGGRFSRGMFGGASFRRISRRGVVVVAR